LLRFLLPRAEAGGKLIISGFPEGIRAQIAVVWLEALVMSHKMLKAFGLTVLSLSLAAVAQAQVPGEPQPINPGTPIEHELANSDTHTYQIQLTAGQFVNFSLDQRAINAVITLIPPDNKQQIEMDFTGAGGKESLSLEAVNTGVYRLTIKGNGRAGQHGSYRLETIVKPTATEADKKRLKAEGLLIEAYQLLKQGNKTLPQVIDKTEPALRIWQELGDSYWTAVSQYRLGSAELDSTHYQEAVKYYEQALQTYRSVKNPAGEAATLYSLGVAFGRLGQLEKTAELHLQSLSLQRQLGDRVGEGRALGGIGVAYTLLGRYEKAVDYLEQALPIYREVGDRGGETLVINNLAANYYLLGRYDKGIEYADQALVISRETKNKTRESAALEGLGVNYLALGQADKAIEYMQQALQISREIKDRRVESYILSGLADAYFTKGQPQKTVEYYELSLTAIREINEKRLEIEPLIGLGSAYVKLGKFEESARSYEQALRLSHELKVRDNEAWALGGLMLLWKARNRSSLAIYFGKQSINLYQEIRTNLRELDADTQRSFLKSKEETYHNLADLLIADGRLPEAEQVIRMLKEDEYFDFIRRDQDQSPKTDKAKLTAEEEAIEKRYREIADQLAAIGTERGTLMDKKSRTPEEEQRLAKLDADLVVAGNAFQKFLTGLEADLGTSSESNAKAFALRESQGLMEDLRELGPGVVALYTLVGEDKYRVILTTADFQKGYEYPIKGADLNRKVLEFREVLQNPKYDPLPLAQELYKILLGPVAKDLAKAKVQTIMWSLDGVLRYVPVSALNDGQHYLVEQYQNAVFTPASEARLKDAPARNWNALGLGVSKAHGERIPALPGVIDEMRGIIREVSPNGAATGTQPGVLPGVVELDEQFTQETMLAQLRQRPKVVHIASHFQFSPGNETNSALLLGDGTFLSLAQIKSLPNIFGGVDLLTLSACNTATGGSGANGKEVEGFGVLAQRQGAKAVVASLWPVADRSTKLLMQEFYRDREARTGESKIAALRQAQLELLRGEISVDASNSGSRQIVHEEGKPETAKQPLFNPDPKKPFAHPYYWAPFILIGNWK
jgi:CHAT domain-containing protein/Flp pilus assembly protein TadD